MLDRDDIIRMAREAHGPITGQWWDMDVTALEKFAELARAAEQEECAQICEEMVIYPAFDIAAAIRARGQT